MSDYKVMTGTRKVISPQNVPLFVSGYLFDHQMKPIKEEVAKIEKDFTKAVSANKDLAGHLQKQFMLPQSLNEHLANILNPYIQDYVTHDPEFQTRYKFGVYRTLNFKFQTAWVNFQKKYEFNPIHDHSGIFSYVIYIKIPYASEDEEAVFPDNSGKRAGKFEFVFPDNKGVIKCLKIPIDKTYEGFALVFPSDLHHTVYPFYTSDEYRITVAGNVFAEFVP